MENVAFFDTKPYDREHFDRLKDRYGISVRYYYDRLTPDTAALASGCRAIVAFVNDNIDREVIASLCENGVEAVALRCAGFNNVDLDAANGKLRIFRVPAYSPSSVAEHAAALLLTLIRKTHRAYNRTRDHNFSLKGLCGMDLYGKTVGLIGTGRVGLSFAAICNGLGMDVIASDPVQSWGRGIEYVDLSELFRRADVISLHCPLTQSTFHLIDRPALRAMKEGVYIINTSRGALIDSEALLEAIKNGKLGGAGLDVYEEESDVFFEDISGSVIRDDVLDMLLCQPNVLITSHQAFLTNEALEAIAKTTLQNLREYFDTGECANEIGTQGMKITI